ncbi:hypothetical protein ERO13_A04G058626v2 [Gossypium hirsutum]|nr:hypothetical protein ERO13_A04G058626v2 [Gossypium hirsutum]
MNEQTGILNSPYSSFFFKVFFFLLLPYFSIFCVLLTMVSLFSTSIVMVLQGSFWRR